MTIHSLTNPHHFVRDCEAKGIYYEFLMEAATCLGQQKVCEMFSGRSCRGGENNVSAGTLQNWLATFKFSKENPDVVDKDPYQSRIVEKKGTMFDEFVALIKTPIDEKIRESWKEMSLGKLSREAVRWGITLGVKNAKALKNLPERMEEMFERRNANIWNKTYGADVEAGVVVVAEDKDTDYRMKNFITLGKLAKERGISYQNKTKDEIVKLLEEFDKKQNESPVEKKEEKTYDYDKMVSKELKELAKNRGFTMYNNMNNTTLRGHHREYDESIKKRAEEQRLKKMEKEEGKEDDEDNVQEFSLVHSNGTEHKLLIREDGMVNATMLCKAGGKFIGDYLRNHTTNEFIEALSSVMGYPITELIIVKQGGIAQGTWIHRKIAYHLAMWVHPPFAVCVSNWLDELFTTGSVKIEKPLLPILDRTTMDLEAEELEKKCNPLLYSNQFVLYMAYIGDGGLVKIGSSDCRLCERESKHVSCESLYPQFRFIACFPISGGCIETTIHSLLDKYRYSYHKQKEIYKPENTLQDFIDMIGKLLEEHDLRFQVQKLRQENIDLKTRNVELEKRVMKCRC